MRKDHWFSNLKSRAKKRISENLRNLLKKKTIKRISENLRKKKTVKRISENQRDQREKNN